METCKVTLLGNHDQGAMFDPDGFNIGAERAIFWTREQLESPSRSRQQPAPLGVPGRIAPLAPVRSTTCSCTARRVIPLSEYIFPEDIYNHRKMERLFQLVGRYCFQGHTHVPGIFTENFQFFAPEEIDLEYTLGEGKLMVNVGSVGQPRDGDNRACYVVLEDGLADDSANGDVERPSPVSFAEDRLSASALRLRDHDPEDLLRSRARTIPGRSAPARTIGSCVHPGDRDGRPEPIVHPSNRGGPTDVFSPAVPSCYSRSATNRRASRVGLRPLLHRTFESARLVRLAARARRVGQPRPAYAPVPGLPHHELTKNGFVLFVSCRLPAG